MQRFKLFFWIDFIGSDSTNYCFGQKAHIQKERE